MRLIDPLTGYPFAPEGIAHIDLNSAGDTGEFRIDGSVHVDSGAYRGKRKIGGGRKRVRDALYMAALNAIRRNGPFRTFYQRLRAAGKPAKLALIAVARKLLTVLNAMIRDRKAYLPAEAT